ncbi:BTB domain-containing protein [Mycena sanguinolenta]|uniref:BTB domain-containing protein n=1 Tax=Mycena sanguinolenta TaxID=230812 RepID=A0A8H7DNS0_9AGAR|nr:BTB domain-containing protein [Mycena sanguinolenta]
MEAEVSRVRPRSDSLGDKDQGPPSQRQKLQQDCEPEVQEIPNPDEASQQQSTAPITAVKDEKYYRSDGDCIIQVEDVLFKIHRYHLSENSSVFQNMFSLPLGTLPSEGQSDGNPIVLSGDTLAQFRAFLSFSYSTPGQVQYNRLTIRDLDKLLDTIQFAHKYLLQDYLLWALQSIKHILDRQQVTVPENQYILILRATALCAPLHSRICETICVQLERKWLAQIKSKTLGLPHALDVAETFHRKNFLVELYLVALERLASYKKPDPAIAVEGPLRGIGAIHQLRVFSGHWFLSVWYKEFIKAPPTNIHISTCPTPSACRNIVHQTWKEVQGGQGSSRGYQTFQLFQGGSVTVSDDVYSPTEVFEKLRKFMGAVDSMLTGRPQVTCPVKAEVENTIAAFKKSFTDNFFALPHYTGV